jgi:ureidoacrylate peracid hydrolase
MVEFAEKVAPDKAALVIIDVQNDYCHDDGALGKAGRDVARIREAIPPMLRLLDSARAKGVLVVHVRMSQNERTKSPAFVEQRLRRFGRDTLICEESSWGAEFYSVKPLPNEPIVTKHRFSAFIDTDLDTILRSAGVETLLIAGMTSDICVESTARDAFQRDYYVIFVEDCIGADDPDIHAMTVRRVDHYFGCVVKSEDAIAAWMARRSAVRASA